MDKTSSGRLKEIIIIAMVFIVFVLVFYFVFASYETEGKKRSVFIEKQPPGEDYINISGNIISIDPIKGDISLRLNFLPHGNYVNEWGALAKDLNVFINSATGKQEHTFPKEKIMSPIDITLGLFDGLVTDYPFDHHLAELIIFAWTNEKAGTINDEGEKTKGNETFEVAAKTKLDFSGSVAGYKIEAESNPENNDYVSAIDIAISRAGSTKFFSVFVMITMWCLTVMIIMLIWSVLTKRKKIEVPFFTFISAMLFAFPAFRNMQPMAPPIGAFPDYIAFFWAEAITAISLIILIITWLVRRNNE